MDMFNHKSTNVLGANGAKPGHKLKQRSRTENHLRSFNISSPRPVGITQSSAVPAYPAPPGTAAAGVGAADNGSAQVQEMRETLPCYQPGGGRVHGADHDQHHGQGHESVHLPVARQFASEWTGGRM